jgi:uncharacterized phage-associated protein
VSVSSKRAAYKICELSDWTVTNLEIQKILYLANMVYLGRNNTLLINEEFEAWKYGPVLPKLYNLLKRFGISPIKKYVFDNEVKIINDDKINQLLTEAWEKLGYKANWELVSMTHRENGAWKKVYEENKNNTITIDHIRNEYMGLSI